MAVESDNNSNSDLTLKTVSEIAVSCGFVATAHYLSSLGLYVICKLFILSKLLIGKYMLILTMKFIFSQPPGSRRHTPGYVIPMSTVSSFHIMLC